LDALVDKSFAWIEARPRGLLGGSQPQPDFQKLLDALLEMKSEMADFKNENAQLRSETNKLASMLQASTTPTTSFNLSTPIKPKPFSLSQTTPQLMAPVKPKGFPLTSGTSTTSTTTTTSTTSTTPTTSSSTKAKDSYKPVTSIDLPMYDCNSPFDDWYQKFLLYANSGKWCEGIRVVTLTHFMPNDIKEFLSRLEPEAFNNCEDLASSLSQLFSSHEKTRNEYVTEFHNIKCGKKECVAAFYIRLSNLAARADITDEETKKEKFLMRLRPVKLNAKVAEKFSSCTTLDQLYAEALQEEKEIKRLDRLYAEDGNSNKGHNNNKKPKVQAAAAPANANGGTPSLLDTSSADLIKANRCSYCTKLVNDAKAPHSYKDCQARYPFYGADEIRAHLKAKTTPPTRTKWPTNHRNKPRVSHLKVNLGLDQ
jgi:hypothetical protein